MRDRVTGKGASSIETRRPRVRDPVVAVIAPSIVTLLTLLDQQLSTTTAALFYVLAVAIAAGIGGAGAGIAASFLSFLALNFFFTPPLHTFVVGKPEDLIALVVFLLVSVITGLLLSASVRATSRAETRERQTRLMNEVTTRLLSGQTLEEALSYLATNLVQLLELADCEITTVMTEPIKISTGAEVGETITVELLAKDVQVGTLRAAPPASRVRLSFEEQGVIENLGGQLSLALESTRLSEEVRNARLDAETNRLRAALFSGVTHDLKTPLSAITASVTSLLEGSGFTAEEHYEHLDTIRQEAEHLDRVVTNLMDLARLRAGVLVPARVPAAVDELIEAVVARLQPLLAGRDVRINLKGDLPEMQIDVIQIDQVLTNLIENAVKFSPAGAPIEIVAAGSTEKVRVTVSDRGPGIPIVDRERVFQAFERGDGEVSGTGLGLAIARAAVAAHGGKMWAQDAPTGGAAVTFELPISLNGHP